MATKLEFPTKQIFDSSQDSGKRVPFLFALKLNLSVSNAYEALSQSEDKGILSRPSLLFESGRRSQKMGRFSLILTQPSLRFKSKGKQVTMQDPSEEKHITGDPFAILKRLLKEREVLKVTDELPLLGGAAGLLAYELKNQIEKFPFKTKDDFDIPDMDLGFYDQGLIFDHFNLKWTFFYIPPSEMLNESGFSYCLQNASKACDDVFLKLTQFKPKEDSEQFSCDIDVSANHDDFVRQVQIAKHYIRMGDIFQANLSHRLSFDCHTHPYDLYRKQGRLNPTCFSSFADFGEYQLVCGSPERLIQVREGQLSTRPIAGTRPRSKEENLDDQLSSDLLLSPKERAEHVMLLDLERNDLGRVCEYGSVRVDEFMLLESYSHVHHIVSNVSGTLRAGKDCIDVLKSIFPGGTITGAPKIRAMQIIDELEARVRGPYTGSLGYFSFHGDCDLNIIIRSLFIQNHQAHLQVGAGIVADSDPEHEYQETLHKAQAFLDVLRDQKKDTPAVSITA